MTCDVFGVCGGCSVMGEYEDQLEGKKSEFLSLFEGLTLPDLDVITSKVDHFRTRAEFRIWHEGEKLFYGMRAKGEGNKVVPITSCPIVDESIETLMSKLHGCLEGNETLSRRLFEVNFLASKDDGIVVSLIYHRKLDEAWREEALKLKELLSIDIIGRSRGQKEIIGRDHVVEKLLVFGETYRYVFIENSFTQPNRSVNEQMISWSVTQAKVYGKGDLVELYCGAGNFTIPLSKVFGKTLATEISTSSIKAAKANCELNGVDTITFVRMSAEEFVQAIGGERPFVRLKDVDLSPFKKGTIFVDPPRAGLDDLTRELVAQYETIIYISCSPQTLRRDLETLRLTHTIQKIAVFDQFPFSHHLESGVVLTKN